MSNAQRDMTSNSSKTKNNAPHFSKQTFCCIINSNDHCQKSLSVASQELLAKMASSTNQYTLSILQVIFLQKVPNEYKIVFIYSD